VRWLVCGINPCYTGIAQRCMLSQGCSLVELGHRNWEEMGKSEAMALCGLWAALGAGKLGIIL